ncbi:hypothetical protein EV426DRAFT_704713 [Tirmania nivea]|nr:hypothetical protein EV426DRAFT_704713 [Tirmania nivea]
MAGNKDESFTSIVASKVGILCEEGVEKLSFGGECRIVEIQIEQAGEGKKAVYSDGSMDNKGNIGAGWNDGMYKEGFKALGHITTLETGWRRGEGSPAAVTSDNGGGLNKRGRGLGKREERCAGRERESAILVPRCSIGGTDMPEMRRTARSRQTVALLCIDGERLGRRWGSWVYMDNPAKAFRKAKEGGRNVMVDLVETFFGRLNL